MSVALLTLLLVTSAADPVVARADGEAITASQLAARAEELGVPPLVALEASIRETILARAAAAAGLARDRALRERVRAERRRLAVQRLLEQVVFPSIRATQDELEALFHLHADQVRLSMVARSTREEAEAVLERLRSGGSLLDEAKGSPDPLLQAKSGVLGWVERRELVPALATAAFTAPTGTPSGPVAVPKGFVVFIVHERQVGSETRIALEAPALRQQVELAKRDTAIDQFLARLRKRLGVRTVPGGHASWTAADGKLLEDAALARGAHRSSQVARALRRFERRLLASTYLEKLGDAIAPPTAAEVEARWRDRGGRGGSADVAPAGLSEEIRRERAQAAMAAHVAKLRAAAHVVVDEAALAQAAARAI